MCVLILLLNDTFSSFWKACNLCPYVIDNKIMSFIYTVLYEMYIIAAILSSYGRSKQLFSKEKKQQHAKSLISQVITC